MRPTVMEINTTTNKIENREMTDQEYEVYLKDQEESELGQTL